ncbi:MAG: MBL fold metallo-hydrolase [Firmicutes bacterium]|nr:MBL fold metallo-hydrolase [Bacillota bacterium]
MRLTVLGCWSPYPRAGGACSSYLLEIGHLKLLLDCGNGSFSQLQRVFDFRRLDGVLVSHFHADHSADLFCLEHAVAGSQRDGSRRAPLKVVVPGEPQMNFESLLKKKEVLEVITWEKLVSGLFTSVSLAALPTTHPLACYAVSITETSTGHKIVYTADTAWMDGLITFARDADLLVCEASLLERDHAYRSVGHLTATEAGRLARLARVKRLLLTHLWPEYDLPTLLEEARQEFLGEIKLATEGLCLLVE